jgi:hypothetical protein
MADLRIDLHVHSFHSPDSLMSLETIIETAPKRGLDGLALTDHATIEGALALAEMAPFTVIIGEEIKTSEGEITAFFLKETIPSGLSPHETIQAIHEQNGVVCVPHPLDRLRSSSVKMEVLLSILDEVDMLETFNSRVILREDNAAAERLAEERGVLQGAGSDAHSPYELGRAYSLVAHPFSDRDSFLDGVANGGIFGKLSPIWVHLSSVWAKRFGTRNR